MAKLTKPDLKGRHLRAADALTACETSRCACCGKETIMNAEKSLRTIFRMLAGELLTTGSLVLEPSGGSLAASVGLAALISRMFGRRRRATGGLLLTTVMFAGAAILSAQAPPPGPNDPFGSSLAQFRSDHVFVTVFPSSANSLVTSFKTLGTTYASPGIVFNDTQYSTTVPWAGLRQYHAASGRIVQPDHDDVVMVNGDGPNIDVQIVGHPELNVEIPNLLSRYSASLPFVQGIQSSPTVDYIAVAAGDLDGAVDGAGNYHDEVVIAFVNNSNVASGGGNVALAVVDYSNSVVYPPGYPASGQITYQAPTVTTFIDSHVFDPGKLTGANLDSGKTPSHILTFDNMLSVAVGNFDGDSAREIALGVVNFANTNTVSVETFRYRSELPAILQIGSQDVQTTTVNQSPSATALNVSVASGDYEGKGTDDLALGFLEWNSDAPTPYGSVGLPVGQAGLPPINTRFAVNVLSGAMKPQQTSLIGIQPGNPTVLVLDQSLAGQIPHQLVIAGAPCADFNPWCGLNGAWPTTILSTGQQRVLVSIPLDTSSLASSGATPPPSTLTLSLTNALGSIPGSSTYALMDPSDKVLNPSGYSPYLDYLALDNYPKIQLVSGLFKMDPANGYTFSRRELAAVWTYPEYCVDGGAKSGCFSALGKYTFPTQYQFSYGFFSVAPDSNSVPQLQSYDSGIVQQAGSARAVHGWDITAGAFRGNAVLASADPPVWSLAIGAWYDSDMVYLSVLEKQPAVGVTGPIGFYGIQSYAVAHASTNTDRLAVVNYDPDGEAAYLGAPMHFTTQITAPVRILEEPPKHTAWLNNSIVNLSRNDGFSTSLTSATGSTMTSSTQASASSTFSKAQAVTASLQAKTDLAIAQNKFSFSDTAKFQQSDNQVRSNFNSSASSSNFTDVAQAISDDYLDFQSQILDVWRYRVYGVTGENQPANMYAYYELAFPRAFTQSTSSAGTKVDWYNPVHENGNLLSYPALPQTGIPADVNPQPYTVNGQVASGVTNGLISANKSYCISSGTGGSQQIGLTGVTDATSSLGWTSTNSWDNDTKIGDMVKVTTGATTWKAGVMVDFSFGQNNSWSNTTSSDNKLTGSQTFLYHIDQSTQPYTVSPVLYDSAAGLLKLIDYVDIPTTGSSPGCATNYWTQVYGTAPDPALNLPNRFTWTSYAKGTDTTTWAVNQTLEREKLRGFSINTHNDVDGYFPIASNPQEGDTVQLAVQVYNYSVGNNAANNVTVRFSAAPYDSSRDNELGCGMPAPGINGIYCPPASRIPLGSTVIPTIPSWGAGRQNWVLATYNWTIPAGFGANYKSPEFRIYVNIDSYPGELNPPQTFCTGVSPDRGCPALIGTTPTDLNWDPLAPGQNNEGWGPTILRLAANTVQAVAAGGGIARSNLQVDGNSLKAIDANGQLKGGRVVAYLGRPLSLRVEASVDGAPIQTQQQVYVYDRNRGEHTMIAGKTLPGVTRRGSYAWFNWTPTTFGEHELTAQFQAPLTNLSQGSMTGKLKVVVVPIPGDVNGDGVVDSRDTAIIMAQIGAAVSQSSCGSACDLNGDGVIDKADLEIAMRNCDHAYCALPPVAEAGEAAITPDSAGAAAGGK